MRPKRKCVTINQQISDDGDNNKKRPKRRCVVKDQQFSDDGDKNKKKVVINSLDNDSLAKIFMLLPIPERIEMEKVCTKWKEACQLAWYDIKKYKCESSIGRSYDNRLLTQLYLEKILSRCGNYLKELFLSNVCDSSIMPFIGDHCKNLTTLECKFDDNFVIDNADHFVQAFTQLDKLKCIQMLLNHRTEKKALNLFEIINSLPEEINEIHILYKYWLHSQRGVLFTLNKFKNLQRLTLIDCSVDELILQEIAEATRLVHLHIEIYEKYIEFHLFDKLVNLEYIQIEILRGVKETKDSTKVLNTIFCKCKNLKHLDIPNNFYDLAKIPLAEWKNLKKLEYLSLSCYEVLPDLADTIVKYCKNLKHLCVKPVCDNIETNVVKKLTKLKNLESLEMNTGCHLSEEAIIAISNNCKKLKRLELDDCTVASAGINGDELSSTSVLNELSKLQYLEHLSLNDVENIEDNAIIAIANNCKNLKYLDIQGYSTITEKAFFALTKLKNLEILKVGYQDISDSYIIRLKGLKEFNCKSCTELTDVGIIQFIKNNPDLEKIDIDGIDDITMDFVIAADQATRNRTNGIILHIIIDDFSIIEASKSIIKSQWLVVKS
ncbi:F-box/LRR-repeat protein 2-like isoform X1 [Aphidius gifuensis]|uniref:F-box/LRR-repeat protein 2-like isoform X1 n=1 Tax=Aphidius gifuensis TaxID=684658 RepID=UPI001CDBEB2F|nr:F-box/LRR-repeat protein 2-like isoform X1 [Aphidius gifuensis]